MNEEDNTNENNRYYIELKFGPNWTFIGCVRDFITNFFSIALSDKSQADIIAIAATELLENAVKYSCESDTNVLVEIMESSSNVRVSLENKAERSNIDTLLNEIEKVCQGTPEEAFTAKMMEAAERTDGKSQLGLARIRHMTGAKLSVLEVPENRVRVQAEFPLICPVG